MIREIVVPEGNTYLLKFPDNYVGKHVEVIAFPIEENENTTKSSVQDALHFYDSIRINLSSYKFNRDEANER